MTMTDYLAEEQPRLEGLAFKIWGNAEADTAEIIATHDGCPVEHVIERTIGTKDLSMLLASMQRQLVEEIYRDHGVA